MKFSINIKALLVFTIVFIVFTAVGTVSHEYGHIAAAKFCGYDTALHYGAMSYYPKGYLKDENSIALHALIKEYRTVEYNDWPSEIKEKVEQYDLILSERYPYENSSCDLYITLGGPLQTILTGTVGLLILLRRRFDILSNGLKMMDWLAVFLSLFWLREVFNLAVSVLSEIFWPDGSWFGGDELGISENLNIWSGTIPISMAIVGFCVAIYVIFKVVPKHIRLTFIISGFIGGIAGYILWMNLIGPIVLP